MTIAGVASAFPEHYYSQRELLDALQHHWNGRLPNPTFLERLHLNSCVEGRHLALPMDAYLDLDTWGKSNNEWMRVAEELGSTAICRAAERAGIELRDLGALFFVSITGVCSPSIDAKLVNRLRLAPDIRRVPIFGLGCAGGAAGISMAADYVRAYPDRAAVLLSVEICSLTLQRDDLSVANLISSGLFADGAAAVVVTGDRCARPGPEIVASRSSFYPDTEPVMGWSISEKGFHIVLSPQVPDVVREHLGGDVDTFLEQNGLSRADIGCWVLHTGGPKILKATQEALGVNGRALAVTWDVLRRTGNISSASVLIVLEEITMHHRPKPGTWSVLAAMGPGFCSELVLLRW